MVGAGERRTLIWTKRRDRVQGVPRTATAERLPDGVLFGEQGCDSGYPGRQEAREQWDMVTRTDRADGRESV